MVRNQTIDRVVDGVSENGIAFMDMLRANNDRLYRFNRIIIDEAQRTQEERADLLRQWLQSPVDVSAFTSGLFETWTRRTRRRVELMRTFVDDLRDLSAGTRSLWERMSEANRQTTRATAQAGREAAGQLAKGAAERANDVSEAAGQTARNLRRQARQADTGLN